MLQFTKFKLSWNICVDLLHLRKWKHWCVFIVTLSNEIQYAGQLRYQNHFLSLSCVCVLDCICLYCLCTSVRASVWVFRLYFMIPQSDTDDSSTSLPYGCDVESMERLLTKERNTHTHAHSHTSTQTFADPYKHPFQTMVNKICEGGLWPALC